MKGISKDFLIKLLLITAAAVLVWNLNWVLSLFSGLRSAVRPLLIGIVIALVINVPVEFFEKKVFYKLKKGKTALSLWCVLIIFVGFFIGFGFLVIPKVVESLQGVISSFSGDSLENLMSSGGFMSFVAEKISMAVSDMMAHLQEYMPQVIKAAENVLSKLINFFLGIFFAIMIISNKKQLKAQLRKLLCRVLKQDRFRAVVDVTDMAMSKFSKYMSGQFFEAVVLGIICYFFMTILRLPYAPLIALITAIANLIPILGAYVGGAFSAILIFAVSPTSALVFVIFIICLQQIESVTTYPVIVGKYVGLSGFWILVAVVIGGALFGFAGVFLGVPVTAFLHEFVGGLLEKKAPSTSFILPPDIKK